MRAPLGKSFASRTPYDMGRAPEHRRLGPPRRVDDRQRLSDGRVETSDARVRRKLTDDPKRRQRQPPLNTEFLWW